MAYEWNAFLDTTLGDSLPRPLKLPLKVYARMEAMEADANGVWRWIRLDGIEADWFDDAANQRLKPTDYFQRAPLLAIEFDPSADPALHIIMHQFTGGAPLAERENDLTDLPEFWLDITLTQTGNNPCQVYTNLRGPPLQYSASTGLASSAAIGKLRQTFDLASYFKPAPITDIESVLHGIPEFEDVVVYDVGQGSAAAMTDRHGRPLLYADVGGGVTRNAHTFPVALNSFCSCTRAPIILSHWDWDHWSSAGLKKDRWLRAHTWIAPMQRALGPSHLAQAQAIDQLGKLLLWGNAQQPTISAGRFRLERCNGRGRNHSGIALIVSGPPGALPLLIPGDARYGVIPSGFNHYDSIIVPHHGADMKATGTPTAPLMQHSRAVYSYGPNNNFGSASQPVSHPAQVTRSEHDTNLWYDAKISNRRPRAVRQTEDRHPIHQLGHVQISWTNSGRLRRTLCNRGQQCDLSPTQ